MLRRRTTYLASICLMLISARFFVPQMPADSLGTWELITLQLPFTFLAADFASPDDGWAVGLGGAIAHWDGLTWTQYASPVKDFDLADVAMLNAHDGWTVGGGGTILHWNGEDWSLASSPTDLNLLGVTFISPDLGWAVGGGRYPENPLEELRIVLRWDGREWSSIPGPIRVGMQWELTSVAALSAEDVWVAGGGDIYHWDGTNWKVFDLSQTAGRTLFSIKLDALDTENIWAVSEELIPDSALTKGVILRWDGQEWTVVHETRLGLYGVSMVTRDFGWAVGGNYDNDRGGNVILHWDGAVWQEVPSPTEMPMRFVWASSPSDGWILAGGTFPTDRAILRYRLRETETPTPLPATTSAPTTRPSNTPAPTTTREPTATSPERPAISDNTSPLQLSEWLAGVIVVLVIGAVGALVVILRRRI